MTNPAHSIRILIIDDDRDYADSLVEYLRDQGYETAASYTVEATREYLGSKASEVNIALIDLYMARDKEAGLKLVGLVSELYPWIVSLVVTGHGDVGDAIRCMQAGAFNYIIKGESPPGLITEMVKKAIAYGVKSAIAYGGKSPVRVSREVVSDINEKIGILVRALHDVQEAIQRMADELQRGPTQE